MDILGNKNLFHAGSDQDFYGDSIALLWEAFLAYYDVRRVYQLSCGPFLGSWLVLQRDLLSVVQLCYFPRGDSECLDMWAAVNRVDIHAKHHLRSEKQRTGADLLWLLKLSGRQDGLQEAWVGTSCLFCNLSCVMYPHLGCDSQYDYNLGSLWFWIQRWRCQISSRTCRQLGPANQLCNFCPFVLLYEQAPQVWI